VKAYVVPAVSFALAVALSFVAGRGYSGVTRAQSSGTKTCVADAKVTAMTVTVKQYHFKLATQPIDASCLPEGFTVNVNDILTFSAESVVARDFDNKKHTVAGPVNFTVVFEKPWKHHFASGVYPW
jgi:hypothetical protein